MNALRGRHARKTVGAAMLAAALAATVAACSQDEPAGADAGPVDLRMAMWSANDSQHALFEEIADAYVADHPDTVSSVSFDALTGGDYITALTTQIAGNDSPDMAWIFEANAPEFVQSGVLYDLTDAFENTDGYNVNDLIPGAMQVWTQEEQYYAYPFSSSPVGIYVNLDLIEAAGQPDPRQLLADGEWTFDALAELSAAVAETTPNVGGFLPGNPYEAWQFSLSQMWGSWGAQGWDEAGTTCEFTSPEMIDFFTWFHHNIYDTGAIPGPGVMYDFASGQLAARTGQMSLTSALADADFAWDFVPLPAGPAGEVPRIGQAGVGVLARSEHPEIAADFLGYFTNPENAALLAEFFPPPRESLLSLDTLSAAAPDLTDEQIQGTVIDQALAGAPQEGHVRFNSMIDPIRSSLDALWTEDGDPAAVAESVCAAIQPQLSAE